MPSECRWPTVRFGDIVRNVKNDVDVRTTDLERYVAGEHMVTDDLHIRRWGTIGDGYLGPAFHRRFVAGQVLYGSRRTYLRKVAVPHFDGVCANTTLVLEANGDVLLQDLLPFIMQTEAFTEYSVKNSKGSVNPYINWGDIATYEFPLPPLDEQRRIAEILWAADIAATRYAEAMSVLEKCEEVLAEAWVTGSLSTANFVESQLGRIPVNWFVVRLGKVANVEYGLTVNASRRQIEPQKPYLRVANVIRGRLDLTEVKTIGSTQEDIERYSLRYGDILVVEGHANVDEIGRAAIWKDEIEECLHQNHILRVRCNTELDPEFLVTFLNSPIGRRHFRRVAKSTSGLNTINSQVLKRMHILLPPVDEQRVIVEALDQLKNRRDSLMSHSESLSRLKNALLGSLLTNSTVPN